MRRVLTILGSLLLAAAGCISTGNSPGESLLTAVRDFNTELRWGRYDQLSPYLRPEIRDRYLEQLGTLGQEIEIIDQDLSNIALRGKDQAVARVQWSWSSKRRSVLEKTTLRQHWEQRNGQWLLLRQERLDGPPLRPVEDPEPLRNPDGGVDGGPRR